MTTEMLDKVVRMQKEFAEMYHTTGLISLDPDKNVHITPEEFFSSFSADEITERPRDSEKYPFEYTAKHNGTTFFCITEKRHGYENE
jgi:hypothetical protein